MAAALELATDFLHFLRQQMYAPGQRLRLRPMGVVALGIIFGVQQLDVLLYMSLGVFCVWLVSTVNDATVLESRPKPRVPAAQYEACGDFSERPSRTTSGQFDDAKTPRKPRLPKPVDDSRRPSHDAKRAALVTTGLGWEADIAEFLSRTAPNKESLEAVQNIAGMVKEALKPIFPEADVVGYPTLMNLETSSQCTFVPEVDIVVKVTEDALIESMQAQVPWLSFEDVRKEGRLDVSKLKKSAIRGCFERLNGKGFAFSRSGFKGFDPKVTLYSPMMRGFESASFTSFDLSINAVVPAVMRVLIEAAAECDSRAKDLITLVTYWAKMRGICFAPRGYLPPYLWTIMTIFFLQVREMGGGFLLPSFAVQYSFGEYSVRTKRDYYKPQPTSPVSVGTLLQEFAAFYAQDFDMSTEVVSIKLGRRIRNSRHLSQVILSDDQSQSLVAPIVEDPTNLFRSLRVPMCWESLCRIRSELARADDLCRKGPLQQLMQRWTGPRELDSCSEDKASNDMWSEVAVEVPVELK
mmetsp:Transcript_96791/g.273502  ORF Transcript_96791/g.273502 Transcript_96791/m.273502 type:complete len:523 (-) Transcript_96791:110-1678(-)